MLDKLFLLLSVLILTCCSSMTPKEKATDLINHGEFEEAKSFVKFKYNTFTENQIDRTITCATTLQKCNSVPTTEYQSRVCTALLNANCAEPVIGKWEDLRKNAMSEIVNREKEQTVLPSYAAACKDGFKWGFFKAKGESTKIKAWHSHQSLDELVGTFESRDKCEEQRLLAADKWQTSKECFERYIGQPQSASLYKARVLVKPKQSNAGVNRSMAIFFSKLNDCQTAIKEGMKYINKSNRQFDIKPAGSSNATRFIGSCEKQSVKLCEPNKAGILFHGDVVD